MTVGTATYLSSILELAPLPTAVPCGRLHAANVLHEWGLRGVTDDAALVVSELLTNAVNATQAMGAAHLVRLWLLSDGSRTMVMVGDASPYPPRRADPGSDAESGRGLLLVEAFSSDWGWYATGQHGIAKVVWAELR
jgi:anti-sigma regulatory factor (Ser/Thr protein kinase)